MRRYAHWQTDRLLRKMTAAARKTARGVEKEAIHDLRVSIRRLRACLRLFAQFYPREARKKLDQSAKALMHAAGDVRDRDIALELLRDAGAPLASMKRTERQRQAAALALAEALQHWNGRGVARAWRRRLEV